MKLLRGTAIAMFSLLVLFVTTPVARAQGKPKAAVDSTQNHLQKIYAAGTPGDAQTVENDSGYIGIGTTAPQTPLDIYGGTGGNAAIRAQIKNNNSAGFADLIVFNDSGLFNGLQIGGSAVTGTQFGVPQANLAKFCSSAAIFAVGTVVASPMILGTSDHERVRIDASGNVGIGTSTPQAMLDVAGDIRASGNVAAKFQDVAEWVPATAHMEPGTVVVLNRTKENEVMPSARSYDTAVAGVVSAQPGVILGVQGDSKAAIATTGRVKVRVDAGSGAIEIGDLLVTGDRPGTAMKSRPIDVGGFAIHRPGTVIGKALQPLARGQGEILVLLSLQ